MKKFLLSAALVAMAASAYAEDYYVIGSDVNGSSWTLAAEDAKFTATDTEGVYEWTGEKLGSGFKINTGTWDEGTPNFGSNGDAIVAGEAYYYVNDGTSGNIALGDYTVVNNPKLVLDINEGTIVLTGEFAGKTAYYIAGINGVWDTPGSNPALEMKSTDDGKYSITLDVTVAEGQFKCATANWANEFGCPEDGAVTIDLEHPSAEVTGTKNFAYTLPEGTYTFTLDLDANTVSVVAGGAAINDVEMDANIAPVYYNLQGVRVDNAKNGLFIEVRGNKAAKVVL